MISIPYGDWAIESVLVNETTVVNNDGIRALEILELEWILQPSGQSFQVIQLTSTSAVLRSDGETYFADFEVNGSHLSLQLSRPNLEERISVQAVSISADDLTFLGGSANEYWSRPTG